MRLSPAAGAFDVVTISGSLSSSHVPAKVIRELRRAAKQGEAAAAAAAASDSLAALGLAE